MSVHYKFKSALDFDTITFDGLHISVADLKKEIIHHKRLGKVIDYDLQITNAQTKEEYSDNAALIPKNTSLIIARVPLAHQPKKGWDPQADKPQIVKPIAKPNPDTLDLSQMNGTEEDKINAMMQQSTMDYDPKGYQKLRGQSQTGEVPANYRCYKCLKPGHWIKNCPLNSLKDPMPEIKRTAGIPRSFIDKDENSEMTEEEQKAFVAPEQKSEIPDDLICSICKDIFTDAVMIPCCGSSFCDECVRTSLLESEDNECPDCKEKGCSPASLIPNRFLRNSVNTFKNETGYSQPQKPAQLKIVHKPPPQSKEASSQIQKQATPEPEKPAQEPEAKKVSDVENKKDVVENKEKESVENTEKKDVLGTAGGHISSHDESDYEDNITVTVPPAHMQSHGPPRTYNGNSSRKNRGDGYYNNHDQDSNRDDDRDNSDATPSEGHIESHQHHQSSSNSQSQMQGYYSSREPMMHHRGQGGGPPMYPPHQNQSGPGGPPNMGRPYMDNNHHQRLPQYQGGPPPPGGYPPYYRQPFMPQRPQGGYAMGPMGPGGPPQRQPGPQHNLAAVYQNVQQKLGTGIIDDPLEAFNRLMQDREARKEHQSRGLGDGRHERHRFSRSPDRYRGKFGGHPGRQWPKSPPGNRGRHISPTGRHRYGERPREDRDRERERDRVKERRRRSSSGSERTSRSPARIPSKSAAPRRRSWSRSPSFRNRSRSRSAVREHDMRVQQYPQHSPRRSVSPRYRQEERSRYRSRGRADSQSRVRSRRRSRERFSPNNGRNVSPPPSVRQLKPTGRYPSERGPSPRRGGYDEFQNIQTDQRSGGSARFSRDRERERRPSKEFQQMPPQNRYDNFDIEGPAANEPPPPGFENSNNYDPYGHSMDGYQRDMNRSGYTPEPKDIENPKRANSTTRKSKHISRSESTEKSVKSSKKHKDADSGEKKKSSTKHSKKQEKEKDSKTKKDLDTSTDSVKVKKVKDKKKKKKDDKEKKKLKKEKKHKKAKTNDTSSENEIKEDPDEFRLDSEKTKSKSKSKSPPPKEEEKPVAIQEEPENIPTSTTEMNESLDLYDDLCMDNDIKFDSSREEDKEIKEDEQNNQKESESKSESEFVAPRDKDKDSSPHTFGKLNDSVLDIYDFGENFDDLNTSMTKVEEPDNEPKPPASKWDEEEGEIVGGDGSDEEIKDNNNSNHPITNEVLRRAENAIFTRAINAIRPIEKKIIRDRSLSRSPAQKVHITIPVNSMHMERSVEIKSDIPPPHPKGSIKDRLGVKVPDSTSGNNHRSTSRPRSPRVDRDRERERERERERDRLRENRKGRSNERERERERDRERPRVNSRGPKERDAAESRSSRDAVSRERAGRERDRDRDEIRRDRPKNDDLKRVRERDERSRREPERSEERIRENRDRERENKDRSRNDREREREQINTRKRLSSPDASTKPTEKRSRHDDDNRDRQREKDLKHSQRERDRDQSDRLKKDDREKDRDQHREREREKDVERENRDKEAHKRKLAEERKSDSSSDSSSSSSDSDSNSDDEKSKKRKKHKKKEKKKKSSKSKKKKEKKSKSKK